MKPEVRTRFVPEVGAPFESVCPFMYLDVKGYVTCAVGNLIDTPEDALSLPWRNDDGSLATRMQVAAEWSYVKSRQDMKLGGGWAFEDITRLRLDAAGMGLAVSRTLDRMDRQLASRFPDYETWPADAQLATLSLSWACGAAFRFPKLEACLRAGDFAGAAEHCEINPKGNSGVIPRNKKNRELYLSAAEDVATAPAFYDVSTVLGQQGALLSLGYTPGPADGKPGPRTRAAVIAFQKDHGLSQDGIVGPKTRAAMAKALAGA